MGRRIVSTQPQVATVGGKADGYFDRIIKYIPSDVVGAWIAVSGIIGVPTAENNSYPMLWAAFAFGVVFTFAWTWRQTSDTGRKIAATQCAIATLAFAVWAFALGGPFQAFEWYEEKLGSIVLIGFTLLTGLVVPRDT
ncbi:hypothetical protein [Sinorhizobium meliloti]|uniref:hypothetical protein n=1 Tax=Rhizobium meliloti TaxID=382 RepID=UPI000FD6C7A7|nr:hypothetical protein [Sinorhizobium meliloti]RVK33827.1 hypothetical protein CN163_23165 [Sinorhizobium meliloti]